MSKIIHAFSGKLDIKSGPVLASGSRYRRDLLLRLGLPFDSIPPDIDESPLKSESPETLVQRLARQKAEKIARLHPNRVVIGSDQLAVLDTKILGKPGERAATIDQLAAFSGRKVTFFTAVTVCALGARSQWHHTDQTLVEFRTLTRPEIERYVEHETPYDCAGGFKCEGLGISLFERIDSSDPTALTGLPLIFVATALRHYGFFCP
ncbi:MAG: septum formation protein Maf [Gammaproteobacteria bacterium]|nr:septum formation protein Maf [Gammaproteobacteria bacterium]